MHLPTYLPTLTFLFLAPMALCTPTTFPPTISRSLHLTKRCPPFDPAGTKNIGNAAGTQFIGGQCLNDGDCAQGCCANPCGICSGLGAAFQAGKAGCGFGGGGGVDGAVGGNVNQNGGGNANGSGNGSENTDGNGANNKANNSGNGRNSSNANGNGGNNGNENRNSCNRD